MNPQGPTISCTGLASSVASLYCLRAGELERWASRPNVRGELGKVGEVSMRIVVVAVLILTLSVAVVMAQLPAPAADTVTANRPVHLEASNLDAVEGTLIEEGRTVPRPTKELLNVATHRISMIH